MPLSWAITRPRRRGLQRPDGISIAEGEAVGVRRVRERIGVVGGFGGVDQPVRGGPRLLTGPGDRQCLDQHCPGECVGVVAACELGAAPLDVSFGLADGHVHRYYGSTGSECRRHP